MMFYFILPVRCALCSFFRFGSARFYLDGSIYVFFSRVFWNAFSGTNFYPKKWLLSQCEINSFIIFCFKKHLSPPKNRIFSQCKICKSKFQLVLLKNHFVIPFYNSFKYVLYMYNSGKPFLKYAEKRYAYKDQRCVEDDGDGSEEDRPQTEMKDRIIQDRPSINSRVAWLSKRKRHLASSAKLL